MRTPSTRGAGVPVRSVALAVLVAFAVGACGEAPPSVAPTVAPTPTPTPNPHLADPTTADAVYRGLGAAGLHMTPNNASAGEGDFVRRINATYLGWPLNITEYRTSKALRKATKWQLDERPGQGEVPVAIAASNILVTWGPQTGAEPLPPNDAQQRALTDLVVALDLLLSPMRAKTVVPITAPGVVIGPTAKPSGSPDATTADGTTTDKP